MGRRIASAGRVRKLALWDGNVWVNPESYPAWGGTRESYAAKLKDIGCTDLYPICWSGNGGWGWTSPVGGLDTKNDNTPEGSFQDFVDLCHSNGVRVHGSFRTNWYGTSTIAAGYDLDPNSSPSEAFVEVDQAGWADWIASVLSGLPGVVDVDGVGIDYIRTDATDMDIEEKKAPVKAVFDACYDAIKSTYPSVEISSATKAWIDANAESTIAPSPQDNGRRAITWYQERPHNVLQFDYGNNYNVTYGLPPNMDDVLSMKQATSHVDGNIMTSSLAIDAELVPGTDTSTFIPSLRAVQKHSNGTIAIFSATMLEFAYIETLKTMTLNGNRI